MGKLKKWQPNHQPVNHSTIPIMEIPQSEIRLLGDSYALHSQFQASVGPADVSPTTHGKLAPVMTSGSSGHPVVAKPQISLDCFVGNLPKTPISSGKKHGFL